MNQLLAEDRGVKQIVAPQDVNGAGFTGARIALDKRDRVAIVVSMGTSTGAAVDFTLRQHDAASAGNSKDLSVDNVYYHKAGAATVFTKVEPTSAAAAYNLASLFANDGGIVIFEVLAEQLDTNNGYGWLSIDMATPGAVAKIVGGEYITGNERHEPAYLNAL